MIILDWSAKRCTLVLTHESFGSAKRDLWREEESSSEGSKEDRKEGVKELGSEGWGIEGRRG
jgi:hypothetical protein